MDLMQSLIASKLLGGGGSSEPILKTKSIYENGTYSAIEDDADGYSNVTVNVPANVINRTLQVNGTFSSAVDNKDGYSNVTIDVQEAPVKTTSLTVTENGTYEPGPASELSLIIPTIPDEVETDISAGATITNFDNLRIEFINKITGVTGHVNIYPSAIAVQQIPMSFKNRTLIIGPDGDHYITIVNGYDSIIVLQKGYTITAMKLTSYSGYFDEITVNVEGGGGDIYKYHWSNDGKICVREGLGEVKWFFKNYNSPGEYKYPQELKRFFPPIGNTPILGPAYSTSDATEQVGWIGFYQNYIKTWSISKAILISGNFYGVVNATDYYTEEQHEVYTDPLDIPDIDISLIEKTITQNGTYSAEDDGYVGYSDIVINVPTGTIIPTIKLKTTTTITTEVI